MEVKIDDVIAWLKKGAMAKLFIVALLAIGGLWAIDWPVLKEYPSLPSSIWARLFATVAVVTVLLAVWVWHLYPKKEWDAEMQMWRDKRSKLHYCPACLSNDKYSVLRMGTHGKYLHCAAAGCRSRFVNRSASWLKQPRVFPVFADIQYPEDDELRDQT